MIELINVSKKYKKQTIFENVNLKIENSGIYLVKGKNGIGKTTLLNIISNLSSYRGSVNNNHLTNMGYLWQNSSLIKYLSVKEHLNLFKIDVKYLKLYGLEEKADSYPCSLSDGQKQRLGIILALYSNNHLIILDEPFSNINEKYLSRIRNEIIKYRENKIIIIVSHNCKYLEKKIDGIITISNNCVNFIDKSKNKKFKNTIESKKFNKEYYKEYNKYNIKKDIRFLGVFLLMFLFLIMLYLFQFISFKLVDTDIKNNLEYNKSYLKECKDIFSGEYKISTCYNPSEKNLNKLDKYWYNYDYLLLFLYSRDDLKVISNPHVELKEGSYPVSDNEVIASEEYKIGEIITIDSNVILGNNKVDFYKETKELKVVGIYKDLFFKEQENIYFDYDVLYRYFESEILVNNNMNLNQYYETLPIENNKYISFSDNNNEMIIFENNEKAFYQSINDILDKLDMMISSIKKMLFIATIYYFIRHSWNILDSKVKTYGYLVSNGFNKKRIICHFSKIYLCLFTILVLLIASCLLVTKDIVLLKELLLFIFILLVIVLSEIYLCYIKRDIGSLMRNKYD